MDGEWPDSGVPMFFKFSVAKSKPKPRFDPEAEAEMGMGYYLIKLNLGPTNDRLFNFTQKVIHF